METKGTYIAFDADGVRDHVCSNLKHFKVVMNWQRTYPNRFDFVNLQEIDFSSTHDTGVVTTLQHRLSQRMSEADRVMVIASPIINTSSDILNWQIRVAVQRFRLPLIVAYAEHRDITEDELDMHRLWLPKAIQQLTDQDRAPIVHIPLTLDKVERAIKTFSKERQVYPWTSRCIF